MFHLEDIDIDEAAANSDVDDPLTTRRLRRQPSTISGGSNEEDSNFSSASCTTAASSEDGDDSVNRNNNANMTTTMSSDGVTISQQKKSTTAPVTFGRLQQQQQQQTKESSKSGSKDGATNNKLPKRVKHRREAAISASSFTELYTLTGEHLGRGAYAAVQTCLHRLTGVEYAVKVIEKRPGNSRTRVIKEIETFHLCAGHPNIVQLVEYFEEDDKFYLIFEKMRGGPLLNHIQRRICFTEHEACLVVRDIANALKFLHDRGVAHRDLKPENILCTYPDRVSPVKLCDLDLASKMTLHAPTAITTPELQSPVGSAEFMAPEVVDAFVGEALSYDKRCDLWSLGVILYIMLCGYPPFYGECDRDDCGWDRGLPCQDCQDSLFARIQKGEYDFPEQDWAHISPRAKDLICHLLVKDVNRRSTVDDVLRHDWLHTDAPKTPLQTPDVLLRNDSARDLAQLAGHFDAVNRFVVHQRLSSRSAIVVETPSYMGLMTPIAATTPGSTTPTGKTMSPISRKVTPIEQFKDMAPFQDCRPAAGMVMNGRGPQQRPSDDGVRVHV